MRHRHTGVGGYYRRRGVGDESATARHQAHRVRARRSWRARRWAVIAYAPVKRASAALVGFVAASTLAAEASAQSVPGLGWALDRFDPAPAGDGMLIAEHPRYARAWDMAASLALEYAVRPLELRRQFADTHIERRDVVAGMFVGQATVAGSFVGRVGVDLSLPLSLVQTGEPALLGSVVLAPADSVVLGDVRLGARVRLFGRAGTSPISLHAGVWVWLPTGSRKGNTSDGAARVEPRVIVAGTAGLVRWSLTTAVLVRREVEGLNLAVNHELRFTGGVTFGLVGGRVRLGPEFYVFTPLASLPDRAGSAVFASGQWGMEALLGGHVGLGAGLTASLGGGFGIERGGGVPAGRVIATLTWRGAPSRNETPEPAGP